MNDTAIKNFCIWARDELRGQVRQKLMEWEVVEDASAELDAIGGRPLTAAEKRQRRELLTQLAKLGEDALVERAAYTWFNRLMAIRYMEANDYLPAHVRLLSNADGSCGSQAVKEALMLDIEGLDRDEVVRLVQQGNDEALFRHIFLAQCDELARCMPAVFEPIGSAMELLLPSGLLRDGSVPDRMVRDIPEEDWRAGVQIVGWMYQYYNAERKDEVFASFKKGKKADAAALAPATQLFTPDWIVRYLVENSLGRLWMRSHPSSTLVDRMPYYIPDEDDAAIPTEGTLSPESITVIDPACGSGHILVYAFDLLVAMYEEEGYALRDIPRFVLENNLTGVEIDPRAAAMASFALTMKGRERDARFLSRGVTPSIVTEVPVKLEGEELALVPDLADHAKLLDAMKHADECGSLFKPEAKDMDAIDEALGRLQESNDLFADSARSKLEQMRANCEPLARTYDVVVANPPYMGGKNMNKWLADWTKKTYPDSKRDLCTCFIERGFTLANPEGYSAMITMQSWMFLSNAEALRSKLLKAFSIETMAHLGTRAFDSIGGEVVSTTATVFKRGTVSDAGSYVRLVDYGNEAEKQEALKEAIANPGCGWFYRRDAESFSVIPGTPIAYWASDAMIRAFVDGISTDSISDFTGSQNITGNNARYLRLWWEISRMDIGELWKSYAKGGSFRRWYGNDEHVVDVSSSAKQFYKDNPTSNYLSKEYWNNEGITYTDITSGKAHFRYLKPTGGFDKSGPGIVRINVDLEALLALLNSSIAQDYFSILNPTIHLQCKDVKQLPLKTESFTSNVTVVGRECLDISKTDWDSFETSWDFQRHPMI